MSESSKPQLRQITREEQLYKILHEVDFKQLLEVANDEG